MAYIHFGISLFSDHSYQEQITSYLLLMHLGLFWKDPHQICNSCNYCNIHFHSTIIDNAPQTTDGQMLQTGGILIRKWLYFCKNQLFSYSISYNSYYHPKCAGMLTCSYFFHQIPLFSAYSFMLFTQQYIVKLQLFV